MPALGHAEGGSWKKKKRFKHSDSQSQSHIRPSSSSPCDIANKHRKNRRPQPNESTTFANVNLAALNCISSSADSTSSNSSSPISLDLRAAVAPSLDIDEKEVTYPSLDRDEWQVNHDLDEESLHQDTLHPVSLPCSSAAAGRSGAASTDLSLLTMGPAAVTIDTESHATSKGLHRVRRTSDNNCHSNASNESPLLKAPSSMNRNSNGFGCCSTATTAPSASSTSTPPHPNPRKGKTSIGRWTTQEHAVFLEGLKMFQGPAWGDISRMIGTRTSTQVRTHAQKFFHKMARMNQTMPHFEAQIQKIKTRLMARGVLSKKQTVTPPSVVAQPNFSFAGIRSFSPPKKKTNNGHNESSANASKAAGSSLHLHSHQPSSNNHSNPSPSLASGNTNANGSANATTNGNGSRPAMKRSRHQLHHEQFPLHINTTTDALDKQSFDDFYSEDQQMGYKISPASLKSILISSSPLGGPSDTTLSPKRHHDDRDRDHEHHAYASSSDPEDAAVFSWPNDTALIGDQPESTSAFSLYSSWQDSDSNRLSDDHGSPEQSHHSQLKIIEDDGSSSPEEEDSMVVFGAQLALADHPSANTTTGLGGSRLDHLQAASTCDWEKLHEMMGKNQHKNQHHHQQQQQQSSSEISTSMDTLPSMNQLLYRPN